MLNNTREAMESRHEQFYCPQCGVVWPNVHGRCSMCGSDDLVPLAAVPWWNPPSPGGNGGGAEKMA